MLTKEELQRSKTITIEDEKYFKKANPTKWINGHNERIDSRIYGHIKQIPIFSKFETITRLKGIEKYLHNNWQPGINGSKNVPAASIVMSSQGGYKDCDYGNVVLYSGYGGDETEDQTLTKFNLSLVLNYRMKYPVRVIRRNTLDSIYAPVENYRYDGLYFVTTYYSELSPYNRKVYKFRLVRLPNQGEIPKNYGIKPLVNRPTRIDYLQATEKRSEGKHKKSILHKTLQQMRRTARQPEHVDRIMFISIFRPDSLINKQKNKTVDIKNGITRRLVSGAPEKQVKQERLPPAPVEQSTNLKLERIKKRKLVVVDDDEIPKKKSK